MGDTTLGTAAVDAAAAGGGGTTAAFEQGRTHQMHRRIRRQVKFAVFTSLLLLVLALVILMILAEQCLSLCTAMWLLMVNGREQLIQSATTSYYCCGAARGLNSVVTAIPRQSDLAKRQHHAEGMKAAVAPLQSPLHTPIAHPNRSTGAWHCCSNLLPAAAPGRPQLSNGPPPLSCRQQHIVDRLAGAVLLRCRAG